MMSEKNLRHRVRDALKPGFVQQIENIVGEGVPDTHYCIEGNIGWIELKYAENLPVRATTAVFKSLNRGLDVEQEAWIFKYVQHGGNAFILPQIGRRYYLVPGKLAYEFNTMTLSQFDHYRIELKQVRGLLLR